MGVKYKSVRIGEFTPDELVLHTKGLAIKTCIITGWQLPEIQEYVNIFEDQLRKFLVDEYMSLNVDEYEYAMRAYGTKITDWGKSVNLSLIRQALDKYIDQRAELSKLEEQKQPEPPKEVIPGPTDWSDTWEKLKQGEIKGILFDLTPWAALYDWAEKTGLFASLWSEKREWERQKWRWMDEVRVKEINRIGIRKEALQATPDERAEMERLKATDWRTDQKVTSALISKTKEHAVKQLLLKLQSENNERHHTAE